MMMRNALDKMECLGLRREKGDEKKRKVNESINKTPRIVTRAPLKISGKEPGNLEAFPVDNRRA